MPVTAHAETAPIYANGSTGDDDNPGTQEAPVKTFAKAKELLQASNASVIYVTGTLVVSSDTSEAWSLSEGQTLRRDLAYQGELINVASGATLTLENIVIDGSFEEDATGVASGGFGQGGSLVGVYYGTLTIGEGASLQNNHIESLGNVYPEAGGAVFANGGTVNVDGGTITGNEAVNGGGIYGIYQTTINMSRGTISANKAIKHTSHSAKGQGGGICVYEGSEINFSGGTITHNSAFEDGGGIAVGNSYVSLKGSPTLTMTGGTITENSAGSTGGGIFVQAGLKEGNTSYNDGTATYGIARITAGYITNNSTTHTGEGADAYGGGGIYVNGNNSLAIAHNGELHLTNAEISGNYATLLGGGFATCPVSVSEISLTNGAAFYGNTTSEENARELYVSSVATSHSGDTSYEMSPSMLGGGAYRWVYDDGTEVPLNELKGVLNSDARETLSLSNDLSANDPGIQEALDKATVHITNNTSATRGGGIGSNGSVFIGTSVDTTEVSVSKVWDDTDDADGIRPDSVEVELYRDGTYVGYQTVESDDTGTWSTTFANLPKDDANGHDYAYTVSEREVAGYTSSVAGNAETGFTITNTRITRSVFVTKAWVGEAGGPVTIHLLADDTDTGQTLTLSEENNWQASFDNLTKYKEGNEIVYSVSEDVPTGYSFAIAGNAATGFTVTNTLIPEEPEPSTTPDDSDTPEDDGETGETDSDTTLPQTGDSDSPVEILSLISASLLAAGTALSIARRRSVQ